MVMALEVADGLQVSDRNVASPPSELAGSFVS
jgi:hypothetical protein